MGFWIAVTIAVFGLIAVGCTGDASDGEVASDPLAELSAEAKECVECHATETPGIASDWDGTAHAAEAVSCVDCHEVPSNSPLAIPNIEGHEDVTVAVAALVAPNTCGECHETQVEQFNESGHFRAALQIEPKEAMAKLVFVHEGRNHPEVSGASNETGCVQCHGTRVEIENGRASSKTWPSAGIGTIWPDESVGNCAVCHTRHAFDIAEARKPAACASCHLGPDHPDIEIYENSKHGQIFDAEGEEWVWDSPPGEWEPGDYRAPTCATCHMSGIGDLTMTHNVSERLYWNLWAPRSEVRDSPDPMSPLTGDGPAGREIMKTVCAECHSSDFADKYFESGDRAVQLYNESYYDPAVAMKADLAERGLLKENPWKDEFQILYYHLWHHEGRRARQGSMMGGPDYAHWHGFFELMQDIYAMEDIYEKRIATGEIEG
jgi:hydroxylamine dehydrogenase